MYCMIKELSVPIADLRYVSLECSQTTCKTVVTIDLEIPYSTNRPIPNFTMPFQCPVCNKEYNLGDKLADLWKIYQALHEHHTKLSFRVKGESVT